MELTPPPSFHITPDWQDIAPDVRRWFSPVWCALAAIPSRTSVAATINGEPVRMWKTRGIGAAKGQTFIHIRNNRAHILANWSTKQIRTL